MSDRIPLSMLDTAATTTEAKRGALRGALSLDILGGFRNKIINGDLEISQRGTSFNVNSYAMDRWRFSPLGSTGSVTQNFFGTNLELPGLTYMPASYAAFTWTSVAGAGNFVLFDQIIEDVSTFAGKMATLTFYARVPTTPIPIAVEFAQVFGSGGSTALTGIDPQKVNLTTSWQKFQLLVNVPSIAGKVVGLNNGIYVRFFMEAGSTYNSRTVSLGQRSGQMYLTHVSLVEGDARTENDPFTPRHIQQELMLCQRYARIMPFGTPGRALDTTRAVFFPTFSPPMRVAPSVSLIGTGSIICDDGGSAYSATSPSISDFSADPTGARVFITGFSGLAGQTLMPLGGAVRKVLFDAEL